METEQTLAWEARQRPRAALAAVAAALAVIAGFVVAGLAFADAPASGLLPALERAPAAGPVGEAPSVRVPYFEYYADRIPTIVLSSVAQGIGFLLMGVALTFLAFATRARVPEFPRAVLFLPILGGVLTAVSYALAPIGTSRGVDAFLDGPRTIDAAGEISEQTLIQMAQFISLPGTLALALGFVLVSLNAMRAGLLTRFMGVLGMLCGALILLPLGGSLPVVQCFWLVALAALLIGRWPGGDPPAWRTGKREPWPTQQQLREARDRSAGPAEREPVAAAVAAPGPAGAPHPASRKRKRKRR